MQHRKASAVCILLIGAIWILSSTSRTVAQPLDPLCEPNPTQPLFPAKKLEQCANNTWFTWNKDSDTVVVFVHGFNSSASRAWYELNSTKPENSRFWPDLLRKDSSFGNPSIFLGGYETEIGSGPYDIRYAASDLLSALNRDIEKRPPVLRAKNILFVAHSMGGILVRHILTRPWNTTLFDRKVIGLALVASPSRGSPYANLTGPILEFFAPLFGTRTATVKQLEVHSSFLSELDIDFNTVVNRETYPALVGIELVETHFLYRNVPLPPIVQRNPPGGISIITSCRAQTTGA